MADDAATTEEGYDWGYLIDGGAIPFVYGTGLTAITLRLFVDPPATPRLFSESEGGAEPHEDTVPEAIVTAYASGGALALGLIPGDDSKLFHLKGYAEAVLTTLAITEIAKASFGRHRPSFSPGDTDLDARRSFFSGHSSVWFGASTYLTLYLNQHVFSRWRGEEDHAFWTFVSAFLLYGSAIYVSSTRVTDNRHHLSDVLVGAGVGTATSLVFYWYQESRYRSAKSPRQPSEYSVWDRARLIPWTSGPGASVMVSF